MIKFETQNSNYCATSNGILIEAPNINVALIRLAMEHDLDKVSVIYISKSEDKDD